MKVYDGADSPILDSWKKDLRSVLWFRCTSSLLPWLRETRQRVDCMPAKRQLFVVFMKFLLEAGGVRQSGDFHGRLPWAR